MILKLLFFTLSITLGSISRNILVLAQELQNVTEELDQPPSNVTINESYIESENSSVVAVSTQKFINCLKNQGHPVVQLANDTELIKLLQPQQKTAIEKDTPALCVLVMFYSKSCPFSTLAAPQFNALARYFPDVKMVAINAMQYPLFNTQNAIVGVPTLLLFHNGRPVVRYNGSEYTLDLFSHFLTRTTGIKPYGDLSVMPADYTGPVTSVPSKETDILLILSWLFIVNCGIYYFTKSNICMWIIETIQKNWRESEAQNEEHEHED